MSNPKELLLTVDPSHDYYIATVMHHTNCIEHQAEMAWLESLTIRQAIKMLVKQRDLFVEHYTNPSGFNTMLDDEDYRKFLKEFAEARRTNNFSFLHVPESTSYHNIFTPNGCYILTCKVAKE